jgi:hypothetical protein
MSCRGGVVGVVDLAVGRDDQHALLQGVENRVEQRALAGQPLHERPQAGIVEPVEAVEHLVERTGLLGGHE